MGEAVSSGEDKAMRMEEDERGSCKDGSSSVVRWERFLPSMVVRVLLVESDDSTRQIISALLRKCNYKVAAVADGLRAWEVLKERSRSFDLILTEIDLPSISGFALLSLIAEDSNCKNIPVIIMSSHDSIGTVHKCMMRGAADFLMKPIRINELKNLWQHVWRRQSCQSAIGCGLSLQVESAAQIKVDEATAENDAETLRQNEDACFKKGSDAQSSCTNRSLEARSGYAEEESQGLSGTKNLNSPVSDDMDLQDDEGSRKNLCTRSDEDLGKSKQGHSLSVIGNDRAESCREAIDLIGAFGNKCSNNGPKIIESSEMNLSWGGFQLTGPESNAGLNKVLIHSNVSAFSRYNNKQSQLLPIESTMNAVEGLSIHVRETKEGSSTYNRSVVSLPMHYREEPEVVLSHEQQRTDADSSKHFGLDCAIFHEQRFMCTSNGNVNSGVDLISAALENGSVDERFLPLDRRNQREAALMKFRLKRKERCYEKKVRYESRKKLADQRPRVKGQFVRRIPPDPPPRHPEVDYASVGG